MVSVALVPRAEQDIQAALGVIALTFYLKEEELLLKVGVRDLEEFWFLFEDKAKVATFVSKLNLGDEAAVQTARLCRPHVSTFRKWSRIASK